MGKSFKDEPYQNHAPCFKDTCRYTATAFGLRQAPVINRSCTRFDSSYAVKRCLKNENILPSLRAIVARKISGKCFIKTLTAKVQRICFNGRQSVHSRTVCGVRIPVCSITASCKENNHSENLPKLVAQDFCLEIRLFSSHHPKDTDSNS